MSWRASAPWRCQPDRPRRGRREGVHSRLRLKSPADGPQPVRLDRWKELVLQDGFVQVLGQWPGEAGLTGPVQILLSGSAADAATAGCLSR